MDIFKKNLIHNNNIPVKEDKICDSDFEKIIEAGRWAPSPFNSQPWEYLLMEDKSLKEKVFEFIKQSDNKINIEKNGKIILKSSKTLIILYNTTRMDPGKNANTLGFICLGAFLSNIHLTSAALNIKIESEYFSLQTKKIKNNLKQLFKIPEHIEIIMILGMWYIDNAYTYDFTIENFSEIISTNIYKDRYPTQYQFKNIEQNTYVVDDVLSLIERRKSYRKKFLQEDISPEHESALLKSALYVPSFSSENKLAWKLILLKDYNIRNKMADLIQKNANEMYMDDRYFSKMKEWISFSDKDINSRKDGIFIHMFLKYLNILFELGIKTMDISFFNFLKKIMVKNFSRAFFHDLVLTSPVLIGIIHDSRDIQNTKEEYQINLISIGAALQNILLSSTSMGIGAQFLSILFDTEESKQKVINELNLPAYFDIVDMIRIGYIDTDAYPPQYLTVQSNVRIPSNKIFHENYYK
ncbi:MAG: nitroreductase family protein [Candidatus Firestonebacteria bacterium]|nr:nitroreductase family protein [Candidatus Firestonebacteria bacterium]